VRVRQRRIKKYLRNLLNSKFASHFPLKLGIVVVVKCPPAHTHLTLIHVRCRELESCHLT